MSYKQDLKAFYEDNAKRKKAVAFAIKITVVALAVCLLLTTVMVIVDMASDASIGDRGDTDGSGKKDRTAPIITINGADDAIYVLVGETVAWRQKVSVSDESGTGKITAVDNSGVDLDKAGTYYVTYTAKDSAGNTATLKVKVVVTKSEFAYSTLMSLVEKKAAALGISKSMPKTEQIFAVYKYVNSPDKTASTANIKFVDESNIPAIDRANWQNDWIEEAIRTLNSEEGDCYSYYSVSKAFFEYLGIENKGIRRNDAQSDMSGTHFWSMVNIGTTDKPMWYFYDGTRLAGAFPDGTNNGCLRTLAELQDYVPNNGQNGFYAFDSADYPKTATDKISR